jgi:cellulose synthase (UDP-forming)
LPNLKLFAKAGFPFTRIADLGETAVLLPDNPSIEAVSIYLDLMSYFGAQTGYPAIRVQVASIAQAEDFPDKDLLVLGSFDDLAISQKLSSKLPASFEDDGVTFSLVSRLGAIPKAINTLDYHQLALLRDGDGRAADGLIAGFESPFTSGRSVVVALARDNDLVPGMALSMVAAMPADAIDDTATIWDAGSFHAYPLLTSPYFIGTLPWYRSIAYSLPQLPLALLAILIFVVLALAAWAGRWLAWRVRERLRPFNKWIGDPDTTTSALLEP